MIRVLFVCLGNICRSPMAEAVFAQLVKNAGLENSIAADSAGCGDWHMGEAPHKGTRVILREAGIEYSGVARRITAGDLTVFDYIITMDDENLHFVQGLEKQLARAGEKSKARIAPLLDFAPQAKQRGIHEVPDPFLVGGFDVVFCLVQAGCSGLLDEIRKAHNL